MEQHSCEQKSSEAPKLCACGFFGNPATLGLCSKCYREAQVKNRQEPAAAAAHSAAAEPCPASDKPAEAPVEAPTAAAEAPGTAAAAAEDVAAPSPEPAAPTPLAAATAASGASEQLPDKPQQANRGRCFCCNKKVGLLGFECRCGFVFCAGHRHAQEHSCTFDYSAFDRERIAKANPLVAGSKLDKL